MKYAKPEIVVVADAVAAIQSMGKNEGVVDRTTGQLSIPAYEADE